MATGLAEALLLTLIASIAMAIAEGAGDVQVTLFGMSVEGSRMEMIVASLVIAVIRGALQLLVAYLPARMSAQAMARLRKRLFDGFVGSTWSVKGSEREGGFQSLMINQVNATAQTIIVMSVTISSLLMFLTLLISAVALSPAAAAVITVASLALFIGLRPMARNLRKSSTNLSTEGIEYAKTTQDVASIAEEIQVFGASPSYRGVFYDQLRAVQRPFQHTRFMSQAVPALYQSTALLILVIALLVVSLAGTQSVTTLGAVVLMLVRAVTYGQRVQTSLTTIDEKVPFMLHLADAIEQYEKHAEVPGSTPLGSIENLEFRDVSYEYTPGKKALENVSFSVKMGEVVGIVGPSGSGKSTLVQLLLRLREPATGDYLVNGLAAQDMQRTDWRKLVAYVPQMPQLVFGSVRENIRFFREDLTDEDVVQAAQRAHVHEDILSLSDGYDTVVGLRSASISGGQAQRICLARAFAANPKVVILDEPTSALDVKSEGLVQQSLEKLAGEAIVFLVAHRLTTLTVCDRVMVIKDAHLEGFETAEELFTSNDFFREVTTITRSVDSDPSAGRLSLGDRL
ncbi:ABC transporter ATP-binding protein [Brachybacterium fresconis]|uniref:ABC-type multidrug transport system fused ATPase/permease subunit n=1 Tax=Brachybacterium fresconis TaxID=173363 RepID=A0ABS4YM96_9MICO|nr:ABC-type multidrug transport system fused ATPase/permease subunit [Brachybacterium fresconis]